MYEINYSPVKTNLQQRIFIDKSKILIRGKRYIKKIKLVR